MRSYLHVAGALFDDTVGRRYIESRKFGVTQSAYGRTEAVRRWLADEPSRNCSPHGSFVIGASTPSVLLWTGWLLGPS
jgi:hypothetical protein